MKRDMVWKDHVKYDENSPTGIVWIVNRGNVKIGKPAGFKQYRNKTIPSHIAIECFDHVYVVSRIIWELHNGSIPSGMVIDHLDGNPFNNNLSNLQCKTSAENSRNTKIRANSKTNIIGISIIDNGFGNKYVKASVSFPDKTQQKNFSISKLGLEKAMQLAELWRASKILELESIGIIYTERHGK